VCRRPETDYRLQVLHAARVAAAATDVHTSPKEATMELASKERSPTEQNPLKQHKMMDVNTDEVSMVSDQEEATGKPVRPTPSAQAETRTDSSSDVAMKDAEPAPVIEVDDEQVVDKVKEGK
jgi:hypothetical protein